MADLALSLVKDQSLLFFDVSTLMLEVSQKLTKKVIVYSHSLDNALVLSGKEGVDFISWEEDFTAKPLLLFASRSPALATSTV